MEKTKDIRPKSCKFDRTDLTCILQGKAVERRKKRKLKEIQ